MNITIIGGGNIGTLLAGELSYRGNKVTVYTNRPDHWRREISVLDGEGTHLFTGKTANVTDNMAEALKTAELIFVTVPSLAFQKTAEKMLPHVKEGQILCVVPGSGGAEFAFRPLMEKGCILAGLQRVHSIARLEQYGASVRMLGRKDSIQLAAIPAGKTEAVAALLEELLQMPCRRLPNYLCVTLTPSNPILHTTRLCSMFRDYREGVTYRENILFYEGWTDDASRLMLACDGELQELCRVIPLPLEDVRSLRVHYEQDTPQDMTRKIRSIQAFRGLTSPMCQVGENAWVPDFSSRYFTADFSYGLKIILDLCRLYGVECKNIQSVWQWYVNCVPAAGETCFRLKLSQAEILELYQ